MIHTSSFLSMQELRLVFTHTCTHTHTHTHTHTNIRTVHTSSLLSLQELRLISKETPGKPGERSLKIFVDFVDIPSAHAAINLLQVHTAGDGCSLEGFLEQSRLMRWCYMYVFYQHTLPLICRWCANVGGNLERSASFKTAALLS